MKNIDIIPGDKEFNSLKDEKVALLDVEGTLTPGNRKVPRDPNPEHVYQIFEGEDLEVKTDLGYWSGLHLLAGEQPTEYFKRVDRWRNDQISSEEFESENMRLLNRLVDRSEHESAEQLLSWYNNTFLNLREDSQDLVNYLKEAGYVIGIISHTSQSLSRVTAEKVGADFVVPTWKFKIHDGRFETVEKSVYADDKSEAVERLREAGAEHLVFVGNGKNDAEIANSADESYMIENQDEVKYRHIDAITGTFNQILDKIEQREDK